METAEDLAEDVARARLGKGYKIERVGEGSMSERLDAAAKLIEADRAAVALAARTELLDELENSMVKYYKSGSSEGLAFRCALGDMRTKYTQPEA